MNKNSKEYIANVKHNVSLRLSKLQVVELLYLLQNSKRHHQDKTEKEYLTDINDMIGQLKQVYKTI